MEILTLNHVCTRNVTLGALLYDKDIDKGKQKTRSTLKCCFHLFLSNKGSTFVLYCLLGIYETLCFQRLITKQNVGLRLLHVTVWFIDTNLSRYCDNKFDLFRPVNSLSDSVFSKKHQTHIVYNWYRFNTNQ